MRENVKELYEQAKQLIDAGDFGEIEANMLYNRCSDDDFDALVELIEGYLRRSNN